MSHFVVMVIGDNIEVQLQPFHEFECTGENDEYIQEIDITEECKRNGLDYHGLHDKTVTNENDVDRNDKHKFGYAIVNSTGDLIKAINRTNPNAKWDYWVVGGRWSRMLRVKDWIYCDSARKKDIDFDGMRVEAAIEATDTYDKVFSIIKEYLHNFIPWTKMCDEIHSGDIKAAREAYNKQSAIQIIRKDKDFRFINIEDFMIDRSDYIQNAANNAVCTFALLKDGEWYERGEMGWWGLVSNEKDQNEWQREFGIMIDNLPDDSLITIVDCHI